MRKVITYGTYDMFHEGHYRLLERARQLGEYLIVGVTSSDFDKNRGKLNVQDSLMTRIKNVEKTGFADEIIIEEYYGQKIDDIKKYNIDIFTVGSDWKGQFDYLRDYCDVIYLERTQGISSTDLRNANSIRLGIWGSERIIKRFCDESKYVSGLTIMGIYSEIHQYTEELVPCVNLPVYTDRNEFLKSCDAIYFCEAPTQQYNTLRFLLENHKHVLCEFPLLLKESELQELFALAKQNSLIFLELIKTAFSPAFTKLIAVAKSGIIGNILAVDATFTQKLGGELFEQVRLANGGSIQSLGTYPFLGIIKLLGSEYTHLQSIIKRRDDVEVFNRVNIIYPHAVATATVAIDAKSEGNLVITGDKGYIRVPAPWWKTEYFEVCFENINNNRKYFYKYEGEGLRYEIAEFVKAIHGNSMPVFLVEDEILAIAKLIHEYNKHEAFYI